MTGPLQLSRRCRRLLPRVDGRGSETAERRSGDQVALEVEGIEDGGVEGEEPL